jgi:hypothetical protein
MADLCYAGDAAYDFHKVKKATGIPRSFLKPVAGGDSKATLMLPGGGFAVMQANEYAFNSALPARYYENLSSRARY